MDEKDGDEKNLRIFVEPHVNSLYYRRKKDKGEFKPYDVVDNDSLLFKYNDLGQVKCCEIPVLSNRTQDIFDFSMKDVADIIIKRENFLAQMFNGILKWFEKKRPEFTGEVRKIMGEEYERKYIGVKNNH